MQNTMPEKRVRKLIVRTGFIALSLYIALMWLVSAQELFVISNGIFFGSFVGVAYAFGPTFYHAIFRQRDYTDARQMTLGFVVLWGAVLFGVGRSIMQDAIDCYFNYSYFASVPRLLASYAAFIQVTAPNFKSDKRTLFVAIVLGVAAAITIIVINRMGNVYVK